MKLLETELIRKYFGCPHYVCNYEDCLKAVAYRILQAMQWPIKKGERFLNLTDNEWSEYQCQAEAIAGFHPWCLRLPDSFQPKRESKGCAGDCMCGGLKKTEYLSDLKPPSTDGCCFICRGISTHTGCYHCPCKGKPDPVEEKIVSIKKLHGSFFDPILMERQLRELVELARRQ